MSFNVSRAAVFLVTLPFAILAPPALAADGGGRQYRDSAGDSNRAPDITNVRVVNDKRGAITFRVAFGNRSATRPDAGDAFALGIDADRNRRTGSATGSDVVVESSLEPTGSLRFGVAVWTGSEYQYSPDLAQRLLALNQRLNNGYGTHAPYVWDVTVPRGVLGISNGFRFWASAVNPAGGEDYLPNDPTTVPYTLTLPKPKHRAARTRLVGGCSLHLDPGVDNVGAPDLLAVRASNDAAGVLTFELFLRGSAVVGEGQLAVVFINADSNFSTGSSTGAEFALSVRKSGGRETYTLERWTGSTWVGVRSIEGWNDATIGFRVPRRLVAVTTRFRFRAAVTIGGGRTDYAPAATAPAYRLT
jgi:hypothetical protein